MPFRLLLTHHTFLKETKSSRLYIGEHLTQGKGVSKAHWQACFGKDDWDHSAKEGEDTLTHCRKCLQNLIFHNPSPPLASDPVGSWLTGGGEVEGKESSEVLILILS